MRRTLIGWTSVLALAACDNGAPGPAPRSAAAPASKSQGPLPALGAVPEFTFVDQTGEPFGIDDLWGKVWVADFIFTSCPGPCVKLTAKMAQIQKDLAAKPGWDDVRLVSVSVDPDDDTPPVLDAYAKKNQADAAHWRFLTGARDAIWRFSKDGLKLDVGAGQPKDGAVFHSEKVVLVDRGGHIRGYYDGTGDPADLERDVAALLAEAPARVEPFPPEALTPDWLEARKQAQIAAAKQIAAFHDFRFTDRLAESGITFRHQMTADSGKDDKAVHYDHGNGVALADVDGDGRLDLFFVSQIGPSELWRNVGKGRFENATEASGISLGGRVGAGVAFADIDNDGDADLFVTTIGGGNLLFENDGHGKFADITQKAGVGYAGHSSGAVFFDYDRDGLLDLFVANVGKYTTYLKGPGGYYIGYADAFAGHLKPERNEPSILYKNMGGNVFKDVTKEAGIVDESWSGDASVIDGNDDGFPDLYLLNMQGEDQYYENAGGKAFTKKSRAVFPKTPWGTMGIKVFDWNGDGRLDVFLTDMHTDMAPQQGMAPDHEKDKIPADQMFPREFLKTDAPLVLGNAFWQKKGPDKYEEVSDAIGAENYWPWGLSVGDLNADGFEDVFIASGMSYPYRYGVNTVLLNDGGKKLADAEFVVGVEPRRHLGRPWFELDCGGADKGHVRCPKDFTGREVVWAARSTRSAAIFDVDDDGDLDIVTSEFNDVPQVLVSDLAAKKPVHFLKVRLVGTKSNRGGIGALVTVRTAAGARVQPADGKSGYLSQSLAPLYFGLGDADHADAIEVTWPSGKKQKVAGPIAANQQIDVQEE